MCNSPVNKDVELSFFTLQVHIGLLLSHWSIIPSSTAACYVVSYSGLIYLMPLLTDPFALLFTEFYLSDFILFFFFSLSKLKLILNLSSGVLHTLLLHAICKFIYTFSSLTVHKEYIITGVRAGFCRTPSFSVWQKDTDNYYFNSV